MRGLISGLALLLILTGCNDSPPVVRVTTTPITSRLIATLAPNPADVNCSDFATHKDAQTYFVTHGGTTSNDPYYLDADHDGIACELLP